jgi:electron transport complex protein RnfG
MKPAKPILRAAAVLGSFSVLALGLVSLVHDGTAARIAANERAALLRSLENLVPADRFDNDPPTDTLAVTDPALGTDRPVTVYRARKHGQPAAAVLSPIAPDGYNGAIRLLVAIAADGTVLGVRVLDHRETPGLGDPIDDTRSNWIFGFDGRSLGDPPESLWKVRRDGGRFDQFAGATITPRAVVEAVRRTLVFFGRNRERLFAEE